MTFADYLLYAVAAVVCVVGFRNVTAVALALYCALVAIAGLGFGVAFGVQTSFLLDVAVIAIIYCKPPPCTCVGASNLERLRSLWDDRTFWDRIVLLCFPAMWVGYGLDPTPQWYVLYWAAMSQFIAAGGETVQTYFKARSAKAGDTGPDFTGMAFALGRRGGGYG